MNYVFAKENTTLADARGLPFRVLAGQPWDANDPLVKRHPHAFSDEPLPEHVGSTRVEGLQRIEQATREPGETRPLRRSA